MLRKETCHIPVGHIDIKREREMQPLLIVPKAQPEAILCHFFHVLIRIVL